MRRPWYQLRAAFVLSVSLLLISPLELVEVHGPDGQVTWVNAAEISSLRQPTSNDLQRYFPKGTRCVISTTNGKFVAAIESCQDIRNRLAGGRLQH